MITIIGNGESRKGIDIDKLKGITVGCNALYLYNKVDYICAMDKFWRDKIIKETTIPLISRVHNTIMQTTLELYDGKWINTNCPYRGYCSGISALDYMSNNHQDTFYLIGLDFDYTGEKVNHIYKGTINHPNADRPAQNENIFLKQFIETVKHYPRNKYVWVSDSNFIIKIGSNFSKIPIDEYKEIAYKNEGQTLD